MSGAVAQFERDLIIERTSAGLAAARKRGKRLGSSVKWQTDMARKAQALLTKGDLNAEEGARTLQVSRRTIPGPQGRAGSRQVASGNIEREEIREAEFFDV
jgi:DNA invertase Pin-like site-specific DNA recombinase